MIDVTIEHYQGQESLRITTPACTYLYHREGCGFAALLDRDGADWISYRPDGGEFGHYRGLPNMGLNAFGHPGYTTGASSTVEALGDAHVRIRSRSADHCWRTQWDIDAECAIQTVEAVARPYWWLFEGTPAGRFQPNIQYRLLPNGERIACSERDFRPGSAARWTAFVDPDCGRSLLVCAHTPERTMDIYWPMGGEGGMTVFGFGRDDLNGPHPRLLTTPALFSFALVESIEPEEIAALFHSIEKRAMVVVSAKPADSNRRLMAQTMTDAEKRIQRDLSQ
jgi:hypothetical protein